MEGLQSQEARTILRLYGKSAISQTLACSHLPERVAWYSLHDACQKMSRVAIRRYATYCQRCEGNGQVPLAFEEALDQLFPPPAPASLYLSCAIRTVWQDARRREVLRRQKEACSLNKAVTGFPDLTAADLVEEERPGQLPDKYLTEKLENEQSRQTLTAIQQGLHRLSPSNRKALIDGLERLGKRKSEALPPMTVAERQRLNRARAALRCEVKKLLKAMGYDTEGVDVLCERASRSPKTARRSRSLASETQSLSAPEQQERLRTYLRKTTWKDQAHAQGNGNVPEAEVNELNGELRTAQPPSPAYRETVRVMDRYAVKTHSPEDPLAAELWERGKSLRRAGDWKGALACFLECSQAAPQFVEARISAGVALFKLGNLQQARRQYLAIIKEYPGTEYACKAASNLSEIYLIWFQTGRRGREQHIERALEYARMGLLRINPARAGNYLLACVHDRRFLEARHFLTTLFAANQPECCPEELMSMLFSIQDKGLIIFWRWLDEQIEGTNS